MSLRAPNKLVAIVLASALGLLGWWYVEAEDFSEARVSGTYVFTHEGITQRVTLRRDHTFEQEDSLNGTIKRSAGTWRVFSSTGHMAFSSSFIDAPHASRGQDQHDVYGVFKNYFGCVSITFDSDTISVKAFKQLFS